MKENRSYPLAFHGKGSEYFGIIILNAILSVVTLGLYYPWAKEKKLKYLYSKNTFDETPFVFSGTGKEMFKGFIRAIGILIVIYVIFIFLVYQKMVAIGLIFFYISLILLLPIAIHGAYRYRMSKTSWKGIRFGYTGDRTELLKLFVKGFLLTIVTIGIYGAWFAMDLRRYIISNIKVGNARFTYSGDGGSFFWMNFKGYLLTIITLGIYIFWWQKDQFEFFVNNLTLEQEDDVLNFKSKATGGDFAGLMIVNLLLLVFTLGFGYAWVVTRTFNFIMNNIEVTGYFSYEALVQSQGDYSNATGEDMADMLDIGII